MQWVQFLKPVKSTDPQGLREYMSQHKEGTYTILDVRQPGEYEREHIPGAKLIPLPELMDRIKELDPEMPTVVYCAVGGRSRAALQLLSGKGFREIQNLTGGIAAWQGRKAIGPIEEGMVYVRGDETPEDIIVLAYGMEEGLRSFYKAMSSERDEGDLKELFSRLSAIEEKHKQKLFDLFIKYDKSVTNREDFEKKIAAKVMEGGITIEDFIEQSSPALQTAQDVLDMAMMIETQALDLYMRYADRSKDKETGNVLHSIADEEKAHLKSLGHLKDSILSIKD